MTVLLLMICVQNITKDTNKMLSFKKYLTEEVVATTRQNMLHLQKMNDLEFIEFVRSISGAMRGKLKNLKVALKIDGLGARFGRDANGKPFFESSRSGPVFDRGAFSTYAQGRGSSGETLLRAQQYDNLFDDIMSSAAMKAVPNDVKVITEIFYNPMAALDDDGITFVTVKYDKNKLGSHLTLFPHAVVYSSNGAPHPDEERILSDIIATSNERIRVMSPSLSMKGDIDISGMIDPILSLGKEAKETLKSLKRDDREAKANLRAIIQSVKDEVAEYILDHESILDKFKLGPEIEGLVLTINGRDIKVTTPAFKASKVKDRLAEAQKKEIVMVFGRFQPPNTGHESLFKKLEQVAAGRKFLIFSSQTQDPKKNPLPYEVKMDFLRKIFPKYAKNIVEDPNIKTVLNAVVYLHKKGYTALTLVCGSDRVEGFTELLNRYNGSNKYNFVDGITVVSNTERDPDSDDATGMSSTKLRDAAKNNDMATFKKGVPSSFKDTTALFDAVRVGMKIK